MPLLRGEIGGISKQAPVSKKVRVVSIVVQLDDFCFLVSRRTFANIHVYLYKPFGLFFLVRGK